VGREGKAVARCMRNKNNTVNNFWSSFNGEEEEEKIMGSGGSRFDMHASGHGCDCCLSLWVRRGRVEC